MAPKFIYFDLGNVLLNFSDQRACQQMSAVCGAPADAIWEVMFTRGLKQRFEAGELTTKDFYETFCRETNTQADCSALEHAGNDIFDLNQTMVPVLAQLEAAGHRLGLLSNINDSHWRFICSGRYGLLPRAFSVLLLSFEVGATKPDPKIYHAAAQRAGVAPSEIFYTDDIPGHVEAARKVGFDAVQYTTTPALVAELQKRGVKFNY